VIVNPTPTLSVNSATTCSGQAATLSASGASSYTWNTGNITSSIIVNPATTTTYTVYGNNVFNCSNFATTSVLVNPTPSVNVTVNNATAPGCANGSATINVSNGTVPYTYQWTPNVSTSSTASNLNGTAGAGTTYTVTVSDANNCTTVYTFSVDCVTSIYSANSAHEIILYPNPNNGQFIIQSDNTYHYKIYNALGQLIKESTLLIDNNTIDISHYGKGIYNIILINNQNQFHTFRIIVN
ncbi:MAG: T9SS type A sorting domain-containing protein, partial [Bacteroidia bacterium]|nr:T9SS type A sorting domain-containing protein [Bacteroidia bacterium]